MLIDWFTVCAQALDFLILVWLMKRYLYKPVLDAINVRETRIAAEIADADAKKAEALKERATFQSKNDDFDKQRAALLSKANDDVKSARQRLLDEARQAADALSAKRQETLRDDARNLNQAISRRTQQEVFGIARKALTDLAASDLEERMCAEFIRRLQAMEGEAKQAFGAALVAAPAPAVLRSAFDLPKEQHTQIQNALNQTFAAEIPVQFLTDTHLISGIELTANGQKLAWSIADYLVSLEHGVDELLKQKGRTDVQPAQERAVAPKPDSSEPSTTAPGKASP